MNRTDSYLSFFFICIYQTIIHAVSFWSKSMFGVDTTSGSLLYSQKMPSLQPFGITVYGDDSQKTSNGK